MSILAPISGLAWLSITTGLNPFRLHMLGMGVPSFMDGLPVKGVFEDGSPPAKRPVVVGARRGLRDEVRRRARRARLKLRGSS